MIIFLIIMLIVALSAKKVVDIVVENQSKKVEPPKVQPEIGTLGIDFKTQIKEYLIKQERPNYLDNNLFLGTAQL